MFSLKVIWKCLCKHTQTYRETIISLSAPIWTFWPVVTPGLWHLLSHIISCIPRWDLTVTARHTILHSEGYSHCNTEWPYPPPLPSAQCQGLWHLLRHSVYTWNLRGCQSRILGFYEVSRMVYDGAPGRIRSAGFTDFRVTATRVSYFTVLWVSYLYMSTVCLVIYDSLGRVYMTFVSFLYSRSVTVVMTVPWHQKESQILRYGSYFWLPLGFETYKTS